MVMVESHATGTMQIIGIVVHSDILVVGFVRYKNATRYYRDCGICCLGPHSPGGGRGVSCNPTLGYNGKGPSIHCGA